MPDLRPHLLLCRPTLRRFATGLALIALGVGLGRTDLLAPPAATAQEEGEMVEESLPEEAANEVRALNRALDSARGELERQDRYVAATESTNALMILAGGGDAIADLEDGNGVDPETFAALYAGLATPEVKQHLSIDDEDRLLYKGRIVRMYSRTRLKNLYERRARYTTTR